MVIDFQIHHGLDKNVLETYLPNFKVIRTFI